MCVGKAGQYHSPVHILLFGVRILQQEIIRCPDRDNSLAVNQDR
jgi:hypothetical protein